jgi:hypothetical protein
LYCFTGVICENAARMKAVPPVDNEQSTAAEDALRRVVDIMPTLIHTGRPDGHSDYFKRG